MLDTDIINMDEPLKTELETYQRELPKLLAEQGKFVLITDSQVIGIYSAYDDALSAGYEKCGMTPFLVKQIQTIEQMHYFTRNILETCPI